MSESEFINIAKNGGYANLPVIRRYVKENRKDNYTEDDLIAVYRLNERRYYLEHKSHENKNTPNYTVYNSQKTGGSY